MTHLTPPHPHPHPQPTLTSPAPQPHPTHTSPSPHHTLTSAHLHPHPTTPSPHPSPTLPSPHPHLHLTPGPPISPLPALPPLAPRTLSLSPSPSSPPFPSLAYPCPPAVSPFLTHAPPLYPPNCSRRFCKREYQLTNESHWSAVATKPQPSRRTTMRVLESKLIRMIRNARWTRGTRKLGIGHSNDFDTPVCVHAWFNKLFVCMQLNRRSPVQVSQFGSCLAYFT